MDSPYAQWGWRIPFVLGAVLAGLLVLYYVFMVSESEIWESRRRGQREKTPLSDLLGQERTQPLAGAGHDDRLLADAEHHHDFHSDRAAGEDAQIAEFALTATLMISYTALFFSYIGAGLMGQRIGRRTFFMIVGPLIAVIGSAHPLHADPHARTCRWAPSWRSSACSRYSSPRLGA